LFFFLSFFDFFAMLTALLPKIVGPD